MAPKTPAGAADTCPNCGEPLRPARVPTDAQRQRAADRETREPLPPDCDTMSAADRAEHGALYRCPACRYETRLTPAA